MYDEQKIISEYKYDFLSIGALAKKYSIGKETVCKILGDNKRSASEAMKFVHQRDKRKHSEETKNKIRLHRIKWMKKNQNNTAWRSSNPSYIESIFSKFILDNHWDERFLIAKEKCVFPYYIDFMFENEKVAVELDGSQHFNEEVKEKDERKDAFLNSKGYYVYRITGAAIKNNLSETMSELFFFLSSKRNKGENGKKIVGLFDYKPDKKIVRPNRRGINRTEKEKALSLRQRKVKERPSLEDLLNDVKNLGYVKTGKKYNVSDNAIRFWIKSYSVGVV